MTPPAVAGTIPFKLSIQLDVSDPEVFSELRARPDGAERTQYALAALRVGVLAMRTASGHVDAAAVREAGARLVADMKEVLTTRASAISAGMQTELQKYLDPKTGALQQRLERLVSKGGELERCLAQQIGPSNSVMAQALAEKLGEGSPIFRMLSPEDARGIKSQLQAAMKLALDEQKTKLLEQSSLDSPESALSRLVGRVESVQHTVANEFSMDNENSALRRMTNLLDETSAQIQRNLTLDDEDSSLARMSRSLGERIDQIARLNTQLVEEVAKLRGKKEADARTTGHGKPFEDQLGELLERIAQDAGDLHEFVGNTTGSISRCKQGDFVTQFGADSAAAGARIVWEAKANASYTLKGALVEMEGARKNREAQVGVFVFAKSAAPDGIAPFARHGDDLVLVWDEENPATDVLVQAAMSVARALAVREAAEEKQNTAAVKEMEDAVRRIERQVKTLAEIQAHAQSIASSTTKISAKAQSMLTELETCVAELDEHVRALREAE